MLLDPVVFPVFIAIVAIVILAIFFHFVPFFLWLSAKVSGVHISLIQLFLMRIRNVPPGVIVPSLIEAHKARSEEHHPRQSGSPLHDGRTCATRGTCLGFGIESQHRPAF